MLEPQGPRLRKRVGADGLFWIGMGLAICGLSLRFELGSFRGPGPGFFPLLSGIFLVGIGVAMVLSQAVLCVKGGTWETSGTAFRSWRLVYTMGLLVAYSLLVDKVGFIITTVVVMFGLFFDWEGKNWLSSLFFSLVSSILSYLVFETWLHCQLPRGLFPWW